MKRSEINRIMREGDAFIREKGFALPPFAYFTPEKWRELDHEYDEIFENRLGWDITDFGGGDYAKLGLLMFTVRSGSPTDPRFKKPYSEKLLVVEEEQVTPLHMHYDRIEDIIVRAGGVLCVQLYNADKSGNRLTDDVLVSRDGRNYYAKAGEIIEFAPGESVSLINYQYHKFWAKKGCGRVLLSEIANVSTHRADGDNLFYEPCSRFPAIDEDEPALHLMVDDLRRLRG